MNSKPQSALRILTLTATAFFGFVCVSAQHFNTKPKPEFCTELREFEKPRRTVLHKFGKNFNGGDTTRNPAESRITDQTNGAPRPENDDAAAGKQEQTEKFHWKNALIQSGIFLGIQHGYRMTQKKTRRELGGAFFRDWGKSVKGLRGWKDPDSFFINYVAHPLQGGLTGRIFVNNSDRAKKQEFGKSRAYWISRFKAMGWSAVWSAQFELGPISEASLGNVGIREKRGRSTMAFVDLVVTPTVGTGVLIGEDAIDKYILKNMVEKNARKTTAKIRILRSVLTPTMSVANLLRGKVPWKRDDRLLK